MSLRQSIYKSHKQLRLMIPPGRATAAGLAAVKDACRPGISTLELDAIAEAAIRDCGGEPNFKLEPGYRHTLCVSVNEDVVHGIPTERRLEPGDIVSIDCGAVVGGWNGDAAITVVLGDDARADTETRVEAGARAEAGDAARVETGTRAGDGAWAEGGAGGGVVAERRLLSAVTEQSLWRGIARLATAKRLNEVGEAIEDYVRSQGNYGILTDYVGHGIGRRMHEEPPVFNFRVRAAGPVVKPGLVVAIEPMVVGGSPETYVRDDGWTVSTVDGRPGAHWEHSVAVHGDGIWVLTAEDGGGAALAPLGVIPRRIP